MADDTYLFDRERNGDTVPGDDLLLEDTGLDDAPAPVDADEQGTLGGAVQRDQDGIDDDAVMTSMDDPYFSPVAPDDDEA